MYWEILRQQNQTLINKDNTRKNRKRADHGYKVRDKVMLDNNDAYRYKTTYEGTFVITKCCTNETVTLQCGAIKIRYNINLINPYTPDTKFEDINSKTNY